MQVGIVDFARESTALTKMLLSAVWDDRADGSINGGTAFSCGTAAEALMVLSERPVDVVFVAAHLPDMDAAGFVREMRAVSRAGVVVVTPPGSDQTETMEARILDAGGDTVWRLRPADRVTDGYRALFAATVRQVCRRASGLATAEVVIGPLRVDLQAATVTANGAVVDLTAREYAVLDILARAHPRRVGPEQFMRQMYPEGGTETRVIGTFVYKIRKKLAAAGVSAVHDLVSFKAGCGYALVALPGDRS